MSYKVSTLLWYWGWSICSPWILWGELRRSSTPPRSRRRSARRQLWPRKHPGPHRGHEGRSGDLRHEVAQWDEADDCGQSFHTTQACRQDSPATVFVSIYMSVEFFRKRPGNKDWIHYEIHNCVCVTFALMFGNQTLVQQPGCVFPPWIPASALNHFSSPLTVKTHTELTVKMTVNLRRMDWSAQCDWTTQCVCVCVSWIFQAGFNFLFHQKINNYCNIADRSAAPPPPTHTQLWILPNVLQKSFGMSSGQIYMCCQ